MKTLAIMIAAGFLSIGISSYTTSAQHVPYPGKNISLKKSKTLVTAVNPWDYWIHIIGNYAASVNSNTAATTNQKDDYKPLNTGPRKKPIKKDM